MMPAGKYWIGDLCYVLHSEWSEFCDITITDNDCLDGEFSLKDGRKFASYRTAYGDGCYTGNVGKYPVDAGLIGCVKLEDIDLTNPDNDIKLGHVVEFSAPFETFSKNGVLWFGHVRIDTGDDEEIEDEYEPEEEYEE